MVLPCDKVFSDFRFTSSSQAPSSAWCSDLKLWLPLLQSETWLQGSQAGVALPLISAHAVHAALISSGRNPGQRGLGGPFPASSARNSSSLSFESARAPSRTRIASYFLELVISYLSLPEC